MNQPHKPSQIPSNSKRVLFSILTLVAILAPGCARKLVFVTHSSVGLDVSGNASFPNRVSLSYNRFEGAIVPRNPADPAHGHSIYGGMDTDVRFGLPPRYSVQQTFATGKAAEYAVEEGGESAAKQGTGAGKVGKVGKETDSTAPLVFITGTTLGIHLSVGEQGTPANALVGYRRSEATTIPMPVPTEEVRSVYADISIAAHIPSGINSTNMAHRSELGGVRIKQSFATGKAAETLARSDQQVRTKLKIRANSGVVAALLDLDQQRERIALLAFEQFTTASPAGQTNVVQESIRLGLTDKGTVVRTFRKSLRHGLPDKPLDQLNALAVYATNHQLD